MTKTPDEFGENRETTGFFYHGETELTTINSWGSERIG
jgi:hypothetical protein